MALHTKEYWKKTLKVGSIITFCKPENRIYENLKSKDLKKQ